jgi:uncharacterized protein CbrC (UPF0167 family)
VLPSFTYHPDPIRSGSVVESDATCRCCQTARGYVYAGPVYADHELDDALCPWCIAEGAAHRTFGATFVDLDAFPPPTPQRAIEEISERTPGYDAWQEERWPSCCDDATSFVAPAGIAEIREQFPELEGSVLNHIMYQANVSGTAATAMLESLHRDLGPTAFIFRCLHCGRYHFHVDQP